jgi:hypothetical protein
MSGIWVIVLIVVYFLPTMIGWNNKNSGSVMVINLFLGWTFIGWVVALAMAMSTNKA